MARSHRQGDTFVGEHLYDCTVPVSLARQVVDELRPGMAPDEVAIARRVLLEALDQLEHQKRRPAIYRETA